MGTTNFHNVNASKIYACMFDQLDETDNGDNNEVTDPDDNIWEYEDFRDYLKEKLYELESTFSADSGKDTDELRSFPSHVIGTLSRTIVHGGQQIEVRLTSVMRCGYYAGSNLDWICDMFIDDTEVEETESEFISEFKWSSKFKGISMLHGKSAFKRTMAMKKNMVQELEKVYGELTSPMNVVSRASNGETIYELCK